MSNTTVLFVEKMSTSVHSIICIFLIYVNLQLIHAILWTVQFVRLAYTNMLAQLCSEALESFKTGLEQSLNGGIGFSSCARICTQSCMLEFDQGCEEAAIRQANWDASNVRDKLRGDVDEHASAVCSVQLVKLRATYEKQVTIELKEPVKCLLREASQEDVWASIRNHLETLAAVSKFSNAVNEFDLDQAAVDTMVQEMRDYARSLVEVLAREESRDVLIFMKDRFLHVLYHDTDSRPNVWTDQREDMIGTITWDACSAALKVLSVMAAIRLTERPDTISHSLFSSLMVDPSSQDSTTIAQTNAFALTKWEEVSLENTLITPVQCVLFWKGFLQWTRQFDHAASICDTQNRATHAHLSENGPGPSPSGPWRLPGWSKLAFQVLKDLAAVALIAAEGSPHRRIVKIICKVLDVLIKVAMAISPLL
ncbi:hypothetical protein CJ030_MR4G007229 [Morella rubra]|uniref:Sey1/RHD3-like three-helix bundle domain-containing protein n=1 Tax=Morella rubra TaxID=262757 RepID=A0A6A1VUQ6_9ROSI|nr:hypothetical protein CJ030_MR4G007229 [Morella rubra]